MIALVLMVGCTANGKPQNTETKPKPKEPETKRINSGVGNATRMSKGTNQIKLWYIEWDAIQVEYNDEGAIGGSMKVVDGLFYDNGQEASTFKADGGNADRQKDELTLWGSVTVYSNEQKLTMTCDKVIWHAEKNILEATGRVKLVGPDYQMGPFDKLMCSPRLRYVSTPDLFKETYESTRR